MATISKGIVVTTSEYTKDFLIPCLNSLKNTHYNLLIVCNDTDPDIAQKWLKQNRNGQDDEVVCNNWNAFELGGIYRGTQHFDEFIHLMDTSIVKNIKFFEKVFDIEGHVFFTNGGYHYMGKFITNDLPEIPKIDNKAEAIRLELRWLHGKQWSHFEPDLPVHTNIFKKGRMILENRYLIKSKGTWSI